MLTWRAHSLGSDDAFDLHSEGQQYDDTLLLVQS